VQINQKGKIIVGFFRIKTIGMILAIMGLLVLLPSCERGESVGKIGVNIDRAVKSIPEDLDEVAKNTAEQLDKISKKASETVEEVSGTVDEASDSIRNVVKNDE
jgi:hypothetical protein